MKAWLVTWDWAGDAAALADKIAAIFPPQWPEDTVARHVENLYALATSTVQELADYAKRPSRNPYRSRWDAPYISCGAHPFLIARKVSGLKIVRGADGFEEVSWTEPDRWRLNEAGHLEKSAEGVSRKTKRRLTGALSDMPIWDRAAGRFKPGWGAGETPNEDR
jgi:hypothetical protein